MIRTAPCLALALLVATACFAGVSRFDAERRGYVEKIRATVRAADPAAADRWLEQALAAIGRLPREKFVPKAARRFAYLPAPLNIGYDQTISDGYVQAVMTAALKLPPHAHVLDVGTGSGYQAAIFALIADQVSSVEIVAPLARTAAVRLRQLHLNNVKVRAGDGFAGWPERAPFDGIIVAAGAAAIPPALINQLKPGGRLVMPIGPSTAQEQLIVATMEANGTVTRCSLGLTAFVPLTGRGERPATTRGLIDRSVRLCFRMPIT